MGFLGEPGLMAAASISGALKQVIESAGLGLTVFRDDIGPGNPGPKYVTIDEAISVTTENLGDEGADDPVTELVQVDLWQPWRAKTDGDPAEDYTLNDRLVAAIHGCHPDGPAVIRSCRVDSTVRLVERDENTVHHANTVRVRRDR